MVAGVELLAVAVAHKVVVDFEVQQLAAAVVDMVAVILAVVAAPAVDIVVVVVTLAVAVVDMGVAADMLFGLESHYVVVAVGAAHYLDVVEEVDLRHAG